MYTEVSDRQKRRADNIIWTSAGCYDFTPDFRAYDSCGLADIYWNVIIGSARKLYDYKQFEELFKGLPDECIDIFWTALEKVIFPAVSSDRPVLSKIRTEHSCELHFKPGSTTEEIVAQARDFFLRWFQVRSKERRKFNLLGIRKKTSPSEVHSFLNGMLWHSEDSYGGSAVSQEKNGVNTKLSEEELRDFFETKFGRPIYSRAKSAELEKELCSGRHTGTHLLFTRGERLDISQIQNGFEAISRQREEGQRKSNREFYYANLRRNKTAISKLSDKIANSVLLHLQPSQVKSDSGLVNPSAAWRATKLNDDRIFLRNENDNAGNLCVDILLDASTSQNGRLEIISSQAFIISESIKKCGIPCRVLSFCSMTGYTVLRVFRESQDIFEYVANGCNRDGLAIRAVHRLMNDESYEHKLLIILSDVKPNDVVTIRPDASSAPLPYEKNAGLTDTAFEVRSARSDGISVICIFTGDDEDIPSAKMVYGRDFVRIQSFEYLADTVGKLIQTQIKNIP